MPHPLLEELRDKARSLTNGNRGDVAKLCEVTASMAVVLCDLCEHGCSVPCRPRFGWPAAAATVAALGTLATIVFRVLA